MAMRSEAQRRAMFAQMAQQERGGTPQGGVAPIKRKKMYPFTRGTLTAQPVALGASMAALALSRPSMSGMGIGLGASAAASGLAYAVARKMRGPKKYTAEERQDYQTALKGGVFGSVGSSIAGVRVHRRRKQRRLQQGSV